MIAIIGTILFFWPVVIITVVVTVIYEINTLIKKNINK